MSEIVKLITNESYMQETAELYKQNDLGHLALAQRFYEIKSKKLYRPVYSCMREFIETELVGMTETKASRLSGIHEKFVLTLGINIKEIAEAGWSRMVMAKPYVNTAEDARYWLDFAKLPQMTDKAFKAEIDLRKTGKDPIQCKHEKAYLVRHCPTCKDKWREYDIATIRNASLQEALHEVGIEANVEQVEQIIINLAAKAYTHDPEPEGD